MLKDQKLTINEFLLKVKLPNQQFEDPILHCLYLIKLDQWENAHNIAQDIETKFGSLLHGFLHRIEGDSWNAGYWYREAGEKDFKGTIEEEWAYILELYCTD